DKMIIPKPFSEISYTLSPPFSVTGMELEAAREQIKKEMEK
ncbi:MAG: GTP-binding protein, partial [Campylobacter sp.]